MLIITEIIGVLVLLSLVGLGVKTAIDWYISKRG